LGVALTVGPGEEHLLDEIDPDHQCFHVRGNYSLIEMWVLLERSRLLISSDTGIAHLAKLVFIPSIILYGPGSPLIHGPGRFWINLPQSSVTVNSYPCRDQNLFFRREVLWLKRCTRKLNQCETPGACMNTITAENVITASKLLLKKI
jgi:ADP-heptose:LPS heptosyltransferase